ncbi:peptidylprolyl isomerase [Pseudoclavibacter sp. RFBJ3]|uniref:peptidylprolyl isomerase n=1 Tax=unclassified Pseudoclavibacter TaxID=2615177 RepID=UPI000CE8C849|nr:MULTISPECIES: peptidylprolyl isomerase [unclassified Pseudoclavibacter]PPF85036.1 peptidylprolyl isomerase [Pseudoclavibacter sp. RFBJ5]PPF94039.1 peptidylprolyl isomerase [Pseudoclavibacter sp. RFBJ3]PPF98756.1 peptidylprolyl isomerase [Pseudoclavibacter sp. RFBH5]PPG24283.1 peptidylprolyl isomerase [Pseudoclavibacter sp. RFBI4]
MATSDKNSREQRRRTREYEARVAVHERGVRRRSRDNRTWTIALVVVALVVGALQVFYFTGGPGAPAPAADETTSPAATPSGEVPDPALAEGRTWTGEMTFNGDLTLGIELDGAAAPQAVANMVSLNGQNYFTDTSCHRLTTEGLFVLQCGDPTGSGTGGPGYSWGPIENAPEDGVYPAGTIAMARQGGNAESMGSQFFIVYEDTILPGDAAGGYTVMGKVTGGLDEFIAGIVEPGVDPASGGGDGAPVAPAVITSLSLQ